MAADIGRNRSTWRRPTAFHNRQVKWGVYVALAAFLAWSLWGILAGVGLSRFTDGLGYGLALLQTMYPPRTESEALIRLGDRLLESVAMAMVATVLGVTISVPIAFGASQNLVSRPIYLFSRTIISISRAIDGLIVAIIAVMAFGFGPLAGIIAISFKTVGFFSKLLSEDVEDIDMGAIESVEATGASRFQTLVYGVVPQIVPRFVGLTVYRWDINIRASAIIGIVGAGGIGQLLMTAYSRYEFDYVASILLGIVLVVLVAEYVSAIVRRRVQ
ncbi:phosphonate ABC transporter, permease protein PhnE [Natrarchaeobius sp. A-rgal3]|uniref:phosphonate ABC transporter, permease protein PhnE n=1 Tax=Natrarchaeobius versutus TaxID=1679078 RepID=UPI0035108E8E